MRQRRLPMKHLPTLRKRKARETSKLTHAMVDHVMLFTTCSAPVLSCYGGYSTVAMKVTQQVTHSKYYCSQRDENFVILWAVAILVLKCKAIDKYSIRNVVMYKTLYGFMHAICVECKKIFNLHCTHRVCYVFILTLVCTFYINHDLELKFYITMERG